MCERCVELEKELKLALREADYWQAERDKPTIELDLLRTHIRTLVEGAKREQAERDNLAAQVEELRSFQVNFQHATKIEREDSHAERDALRTALAEAKDVLTDALLVTTGTGSVPYNPAWIDRARKLLATEPEGSPDA